MLKLTWYLQQGSNCQEAVYNPVHSKDKRPNGVYMYGRLSQNNPE